MRRIYKEDIQTIKRTIQALEPEMFTAAQGVYDAWEQDESGVSDEYGGGGICDDIGAEIATIIMNNTSYDAVTIYNEYDYHTSVYVYDTLSKTILHVNIPPGVYETGAGYEWTKMKDVIFSSGDIIYDDMSWNWDEMFDEDDDIRDY